MTLAAPVVETQQTDCRHCGQPVPENAYEEDFCCAGCRFVHDLLQENGLNKFYDLRGGKGQPVKTHVFEPRDFDWLQELVEAHEARPGDESSPLLLDIQGITCLGCVWLIEKVFQALPGARSIEINAALGQVRLEWTAGAFDAPAFAREIQSYGYLLAPPGTKDGRESTVLVRKMGVCAALAGNCMLFTLPGYLGMGRDFEYARLFEFLAMVFATASMMAGGGYFIRRAFQGLRRNAVSIDLPIALGITFAYGGSLFAWARGDHSFVYFDFVAIFIFLMLVGRWTHQRAVEANRNFLLEQQSHRRKVTLLDATGERPADLNELLAGARFRIAPGQFLPVRSLLLTPAASFGMEWINGEPEARLYRKGQVVPGGAIPLDSRAPEFRAEEDWNGSFLDRLTALDQRAAERYPLVERVISIYIACVLVIGAIGFTAWQMGTGDTYAALQVLVSVLVVSCPCAIGVAWPLNDELAASALRRHGIFVREKGLWQRLRRVRKILFDKTGTLTLEHLVLTNPEALRALPEHTRGVLLRMVEGSLHPVSRCLRQYLVGLPENHPASEDLMPIAELPGKGLKAITLEGIWRLGKPDWARSGDASPSENREADCLLTLNGDVLAEFHLAEEARADARREIERWQAEGYEVHILSGDRPEKVRALAQRLCLPEYRALGGLSPDDKAEWIRRHDDRDTLMVGDGANDSLAFDATWCRGTPAVDRGVLEQKADFYFLGKGIDGIRRLFQVSDTRGRTLRRVFAFTVVYNALTLTLCLAGKMNPLIAAIVMPLSSLISVTSVWIQRPK